MIKDLTGRETITARHIHQREFQFKPLFKFWLITNHKPNMKSQDKGLWRRIKLVPFEVTMPDNEIDRNLDIKLKKESSGILNWMIEGCLLWQTEGMNVPDEIKEATQEYKEDMDILGEFFKQCCEMKKSLMTPNKWLYMTYKAWCNVNGIKPLSHVVFPRAMNERGFKKAGRNNKGAVWASVGLNQHILETCIKIETESGADESAGVLVLTAFLKSFLSIHTRETIYNKPTQSTQLKTIKDTDNENNNHKPAQKPTLCAGYLAQKEQKTNILKNKEKGTESGYRLSQTALGR